MKSLLPILALVTVACGSSSTSPTPVQSTPTPTATTFTLSGTVTSTTGAAISGATVRIVDSANSGKSATTNASGAYSLTGLTTAGMTVNASATNYVASSKGVTLTSSQTVDFQLAPTPLFAVSGSGDTVFDMPTTVSRIRVNATYTGNSSNFIVKVNGRLLVNELVGRAWNQVTFEGTYLTTGGVTEITNSSGVQWSFTEVR